MDNRTIWFLTFGDINYDQRMQRIWKTLHEAGYSVNILARSLYNEDLPTSYKVYKFKPWFVKGFAAYAEFNLRAFLFLLFRKTKLISCVDLDTLLPGILIKFIKKNEVCFDAHELYTELPELANRPVVKKFWAFLADKCISRADYVYTVSQGFAAYINEKYGQNCTVIRNFPVFSFSGQRNESLQSFQNKTLIYQGAVNEGRGVEQLVESMIFLPEYKLLIAGKGDKSEIIETLVKNLKLSDRVSFLGQISPDELKQITLKADLGINLLNQTGLSYYYSLANKFFDYVQAGLPQLCIDFPEYRLLNQTFRVAFLIDKLDPEKIAMSISAIFNDIQLYHQMTINTKLAAAEWCWEKEEGRLLELYSKIPALKA